MSSSALTLKGFRRWLERHPTATFRSGSACRCPIARYLTSIRGKGSSMYVHSYYVPVKGTAKSSNHAAPLWATLFVKEWDAVKKSKAVVTGKQSLEILMRSAYRKA